MKDNISKIISIAFLSFSILLLFYVFYRSHVIHGGIRIDYYLQHYIVAFLFIILSLISFFIPKKLKINITVVFVSIIIALYIIEGYLTIQTDLYSKQPYNIHTKEKFEIYKNNTGKDYDKRTRFEIYTDLKKEDPNIVVAISPKLFLNYKNLNYLSLSGLANRKTIHCNENGYYSIYQSDRYGFSNPDEEWDKNEIEFFLVGDSAAQGACVNEPDTISANLRKLSNNKNGVLNLGYGGNGSLIEYATLREYFPSKKVKRVLWLFHGNDMRFIETELKNKILVNYLNDKNFSQNLILRKQEVEKILLKKLEQEISKLTGEIETEEKRFITEQKALEEGGKGATEYFDLIKFVRLDSIRGIMIPTITTAQKMAFKNVLQLSNEFTKQNNSKLYFVYIPDINTNFINDKKIIHIIESLNIPVIDIKKELIKKHKDPLSLYPFRIRTNFYGGTHHFSEKGYRLIAETIFTKINELER
jgi:hypothetical protein